jgi:PAS domain S-box-containing protein
MKLWFKKSSEGKPETGRGAAGEPDALPDQPGIASPSDNAKASPHTGTPDTAAPSAPPPPSAEAGQSPRALFQQLLDGQYDAVLITDLKGHIVNTNRRMQEFFGYAADESWDLPIGRLVPGITQTMILQILRGLAQERYVLIEGRCIRKDEHSFPAEIAISQIALATDGNLLFSVRNIERRQQLMQRLQSARRLLDQIPTPAVACDKEGRIKVANLAMAKMLGYDTSDVLLDQPFSCVWNEQRAADVVARALNGESVKEPITLINRRGRTLHLVITLSPEQDARDKDVGFLAAFTSASVVTLNSR